MHETHTLVTEMETEPLHATWDIGDAVTENRLHAGKIAGGTKLKTFFKQSII